jgi:hypothetical protein
MKFLHVTTAFTLLVCVASLSAKADEPTRDAQREITHLLQYLEASKCAFYRNGTWHNSQEARTHIEGKYKALKRTSAVATAEDFVARAATSSSASGVPYRVRCGDAEPVGSAEWLMIELKRYRAASAAAK